MKWITKAESVHSESEDLPNSHKNIKECRAGGGGEIVS